MSAAAPPPPPPPNQNNEPSASGSTGPSLPLASSLKEMIEAKDPKELNKKMKHLSKILGLDAKPMSLSMHQWDPSQPEDSTTRELLPQTMLRIKRDLKEFFTDPVPEVFLVPDSKDITIAHAIVIGPVDTPYEGGFFYFFVKFPGDYPIRPPKVKLMTTGGDTVRFNPNLYRSGKVCLSILGTWSGPGWSPANNLQSVLLSIQSLMNEKPYHNEPGFEEKSLGRRRLAIGPDPVTQYNDIICHETIRVAVLDMMENNNTDTRYMPKELHEMIVECFRMRCEHYEKVIKDNMSKTGQEMKDPFSEPRGKFDYKKLEERLNVLKSKYLSVQEGAAMSRGTGYHDIAAHHARAEDEPNFPNANSQEVDAQAAIDDANYYLDEEGTSGDSEDDMYIESEEEEEEEKQVVA